MKKYYTFKSDIIKKFIVYLAISLIILILSISAYATEYRTSGYTITPSESELDFSVFEKASYITGIERFGSITVIGNASLPLVENSVTRVLKYTVSSGWEPSVGIAKLTNSAQPSVYPYAAFEGSNAVEGFLSASSDGNHIITNTIPDGINLTEEKYLVFAIDIPSFSGKATDVKLTMISDYGVKHESVFSVSSTGWNAVFVNLSDFIDKFSEYNEYYPLIITKISISLITEKNATFNGNTSFCIDYLSTSSIDSLQLYRFLSDDYSSDDGTLNYDDKQLIYTLSHTGKISEENENNYICSCYTNTNKYNMLGCANSVKLSFENTSCTEVICSYTEKADEEFSNEKSVICRISESDEKNGITSCYFPLTTDYIYALKFTFVATERSPITIYTVTTASGIFDSSSSAIVGTVDSCKISDNKREIIVRGKISGDIVMQNQSAKICLFELDQSVTVNSSAVSYLTPIAQTNMSVEYTVKKAYTDKSCLDKKYVVAIRTDSGYTIVGSEKYISNPKILAESDSVKSNGIVKGIVTEATSARLLCSGSTVIDVNINELFETGSSVTQYPYNESIYSFNSDFINSLDSAINSYKLGGSEIYIRILLEKSENSSVSALLIHPDALLSPITDTQYYAFNTADSKGISALGAAVEFISSRYASEKSEHTQISGFIFGDGIDRQWKSYYAGQKTLAEFTECAAKAIRIVYAHSQTVNSALKLYVSFGSDWYNGIQAESLTEYDTRELIIALGKYTDIIGGFEWLPAFDVDYDFDNNGNCGYESKTVNADFLSTLCSFIAKNELTYNGSPRSVMLLGHPKNDNDTAVAEYIYSFYRSCESSCKLITHYILFPSFDTKEYSDVLTFIDSASSIHYTEDYAKKLANGKYENWNALFGEGINNLFTVARDISKATVLNSVPQEIIGSVDLWSFDEETEGESNTDGWTAGDYCASLEISDALGKNDIIVAEIEKSDCEKWRTIYNRFDYKRDFSIFPFISFDVKLLTLPNDIDCAELCVMLKSGNDFSIARKTIMADDWNKVIISFAEFSGINNVDGIYISLRGIDGKINIASPTLIISDFVGLSDCYDDKQLSNAIASEKAKNSQNENIDNSKKSIAVLALCVFGICVIFEPVYITVRVRKIRKITTAEERRGDIILSTSRYHDHRDYRE